VPDLALLRADSGYNNLFNSFSKALSIFGGQTAFKAHGSSQSDVGESPIGAGGSRVSKPDNEK
jgi:hypothetical protein